MKHVISTANFVFTIAATVLWAGLVAARAEDQEESKVVVTAHAQSGGDDWVAPSPGQVQNQITIQTVEPDGKKKQAKEVTWLGLAVEESSEALSSQLGLKTGEGLTVNFIAAGSPAAKADFHKNDVLVELDGQMLVHPLQLRKLVQMHAGGDTVQLTFYRGGKRQTATVKLGKTTWDEASGMEVQPASDPFQNLQFQLDGLNGQLHGMGESLARANLEKGKMNIEVKRTMEQTRKAIQNAVRRASKDRKSLSDADRAEADRELQALVGEGVEVDKDATVIVRNKHNSMKTIVQSDENGTYIIEAGAKKHLTAHDNNGKLLFDGEVDTPAEQEKVPKEVWEKAKAMLEQIAEPTGSEPKEESKGGEKPDS
jgi:membrane-associated protease RseP (regulator of RpoE activity)